VFDNTNEDMTSVAAPGIPTDHCCRLPWPHLTGRLGEKARWLRWTRRRRCDQRSGARKGATTRGAASARVGSRLRSWAVSPQAEPTGHGRDPGSFDRRSIVLSIVLDNDRSDLRFPLPSPHRNAPRLRRRAPATPLRHSGLSERGALSSTVLTRLRRFQEGAKGRGSMKA
jgi:hypothetical protein